MSQTNTIAMGGSQLAQSGSQQLQNKIANQIQVINIVRISVELLNINI